MCILNTCTCVEDYESVPGYKRCLPLQDVHKKRFDSSDNFTLSVMYCTRKGEALKLSTGAS